ncbi:MAG TPA: hypothetical protein VLN74_08745 [Ilumatobacteraceae bacterium]|nr:hypothetical protein [Ilumatobacteraceae bacterium]
MSNDAGPVKVTAANIEPAIALAEPVPESASASYQVTTLEFSAKEPSRFGRMFKGGDGISVTVDPSPVEGGAFLWSTQVRFPRGTDFEREFGRVGLDWPVWWSIPDMTHLVEKARLLEFVGFAWPELALAWFVRLHAAAAGVDALAPVVVTRSVKSPMRAEHEEIEDLDDLVDELQESALSDAFKQQAYGEWQARAAEQSG